MRVNTGLPHGTFKRRDAHPTIANRFFAGYSCARGKEGEYGEAWLTLDQMGPKRRAGRAKRKYKKIPDDERKIPKLQTGRKVGHFKRGDKHPEFDRVFVGYIKRKVERWLKPETFERQEVARRIRANSYPRVAKLMPEHIKLHRQGVREEINLTARLEREYLLAWGRYGDSVSRRYDSKIRAAERRRKYRRENPAYRAAHRIARKRRRDRIRLEFNALPLEKKLEANRIYNWRTMLNNLHGRVVFVVDHVNPLANGGKHAPNNLIVTTYDYNEWKSDKLDASPHSFDPATYHKQ